MKKVILITMFSFSFAVYNVGQTVSINDQNFERTTCYAGNGYEVDDIWTLGDWNGDLNGGTYNVTFIEMHASW